MRPACLPCSREYTPCVQMSTALCVCMYREIRHRGEGWTLYARGFRAPEATPTPGPVANPGAGASLSATTTTTHADHPPDHDPVLVLIAQDTHPTSTHPSCITLRACPSTSPRTSPRYTRWARTGQRYARPDRVNTPPDVARYCPARCRIAGDLIDCRSTARLREPGAILPSSCPRRRRALRLDLVLAPYGTK